MITYVQSRRISCIYEEYHLQSFSQRRKGKKIKIYVQENEKKENGRLFVMCYKILKYIFSI